MVLLGAWSALRGCGQLVSSRNTLVLHECVVLCFRYTGCKYRPQLNYLFGYAT